MCLNGLEHVHHVARVGDQDDSQGVGDGSVQARRQTVDVKVGHDGNDHVFGSAFRPNVKEGGVGDQVAVGELCALGAAGGTTGVD